MTELSPAAQAILDAAEAGLDGYIELLPPTWKSSVAAALRAAAEQGETLYLEGCPVHAVTVGNLLAIATELEA